VGFALSYSVKLGLMGILFVILLNCVSYLEESYLREGADEDVANVEYGSMLVTQTITQIRTISSLHIESKLLRDYKQSLLNLKR
jgi:ABC-type bacteriocin/lantibiotic exporter with double-glycine peptidase domain